MKVHELKELLGPLNDQMDIFIDNGREELFSGARIDNLTESLEDDTVIGYVLVGERLSTDEEPTQLKLPFGDD